MKLFLFAILLLTYCSCDDNSAKKKSSISNEQKYFYVFEYTDLRNTDTNHVGQDTLLLIHENDSAAYLEGFFLFLRQKSDWTFSKPEKNKRPVSYKVLNTRFENIKLTLSALTLKEIDSIAALNVTVDRNARFDSTGNIRNVDPSKKGLKHTIDSIILQKTIKDEKRPTKI